MNNITVNTAMPPMVKFAVDYKEDRNATLIKNEFVGIEFDKIVITPHGTKDYYEFEYKDWLGQTRQQVSENRFPREWLQMIEQQYRAWKNDTPVPTFGTPLKDWKHVTPQVLAAMKANNISTIEELATANEDTIRRLGMGSRILHQKAKQYLEQRPIDTEEVIKQQLLEEDEKFSKELQKRKEAEAILASKSNTESNTESKTEFIDKAK